MILGGIFGHMSTRPANLWTYAGETGLEIECLNRGTSVILGTDLNKLGWIADITSPEP
jgi:hypothetical protein